MRITNSEKLKMVLKHVSDGKSLSHISDKYGKIEKEIDYRVLEIEEKELIVSVELKRKIEVNVHVIKRVKNGRI